MFRRSNYYKCLPKDIYPLKNDEIVYNNSVYVIKDNNYNLLNNPFETACIACAAIKNPKLSKDKMKYANPEDKQLMEDKIRMIFQVGYLCGHDSLILGALGCGAYYNPIMEVIEIFNKVLKDYNGCFKMIGFPIYSVKDNNYDYFKKYLITDP